MLAAAASVQGARDITAQHRYVIPFDAVQRRARRSTLDAMEAHRGPVWDTPLVHRVTHRFGGEGRK